MIKKIVRYVGLICLTYILICLVTPFLDVLKNRSIENQINYLSGIIDKGYDDKLQQRFPEGKLFSNAILALSTIEYCEKSKQFDIKYSSIVDKCIQRIQSTKTTKIFDSDLIPMYGMFYNGWSNLVYSKYKESSLFHQSHIQLEVMQAYSEIESCIINIQNDSLRILDTYSGVNWPADNLIGISSISNDTLKAKWLKMLLDQSKHPSGLIHHIGSNPLVVRGSSSAMITYFLGQSKYQDVNNYNQVFQSIFIDKYFGIDLVKENEDGSNKMDVDSGPVVFGYGASATIMNIKTQASFNNSNSKLTWAAMNTIAFPINIFNNKYYLMKKEPMLDLFMLWASTEL